jgi:apolipoprotein N-acyltransferase
MATNRINFILFFSVFWTIFEYLRGVIFTGFPWNLVGYAAYDVPFLAQMADILGIYGVSFALILSISLLTYGRTTRYAGLTLAIPLIYGLYRTEFYGA